MAELNKKLLIQSFSRFVEGLAEDEINEILGGISQNKKEVIPISAFRGKISALEIIVKYMKEVGGLPLKTISIKLNRSPSTVYSTYSNAKKKFNKKLDTSDFTVSVPLSEFADRKYSVLESLVSYLRDKEKLPAARISKMLHKNPNTISTVYKRYLDKKRKK